MLLKLPLIMHNQEKLIIPFLFQFISHSALTLLSGSSLALYILQALISDPAARREPPSHHQFTIVTTRNDSLGSQSSMDAISDLRSWSFRFPTFSPLRLNQLWTGQSSTSVSHPLFPFHIFVRMLQYVPPI